MEATDHKLFSSCAQLARLRDQMGRLREENRKYREVNRAAEFEAATRELREQLLRVEADKVWATSALH